MCFIAPVLHLALWNILVSSEFDTELDRRVMYWVAVLSSRTVNCVTVLYEHSGQARRSPYIESAERRDSEVSLGHSVLESSV